MATANGYNDDDRKRIVSAMQSMRDRLGGFLAKTYGDDFDGDIDTMLEAVNFMKAVRIEKPAAVPVADALRDSLGAMEAHARMYPHMDKGFMVDARNKAKRALSTQAPPAAAVQGWSGWATQYPGKMPKLYGAEEIARLNWCPQEGADLVRVVEVDRVKASDWAAALAANKENGKSVAAADRYGPFDMVAGQTDPNEDVP